METLEPRWLLSADLAEDHGFGSSHHDDIHDHMAHPAAIAEIVSGGSDVHTVYNQGGGGSAGGSGNSGPNIEIVDAYVRDGLGNEITSPLLGQRVAIQVHFKTYDLPFDATYTFHYTVDGVTLNNGTQSFGAGFAVFTGTWWRSGWFASSGTHNVTVTLDPHDDVFENNESDNSLSFTYTTVTAAPPQQLQWPIEGTPNGPTTFTNYVDVNPLGGVTDFAGGSYSYNGHNAWDIGPSTFTFQDAGIDLYAAADGVVTETNDGNFDRQVQWSTPAPEANYIIIDHGGGWTTVYWHLRRDSIQVEVGDTVQAGQLIGLMGSSGFSTASHVHFGLRHHGFTVEPMYDTATYLVPSLASTIGYVGDTKLFLDSGVTSSNPAPHIKDRPSDVEVFKQESSQTVFAWGYYGGLRIGDVLRWDWKKPDGSLFTTTQHPIAADFAQSWYWWSRTLPNLPDLGTWTIVHHVNNVEIGQESFVVTTGGAPEIRVEQLGNILIDERVTPVNFGTTAQSGQPIGQSFNIINHGGAPLSIGQVTVPRGFLVTDAPAASIDPGQADVLTITMDSTTPGYFGGQVRIETNDADENPYEFSVEGVISSASEKLWLGLAERKTLEGTQFVGNVRRENVGATDLTVNLISNDTGEATVPASVVIPAGSTSVLFPVTAVQDGETDVTKIVEIQAASSSTDSAWNEIAVINRAPAPTVESVVLNNGQSQRSSLDSVRVTFSELVPVPGNPFRFTNTVTGAIANHNPTISVIDNKTVVDFTFTSEINPNASLVDGTYQLTVDASLIVVNGQPLDGDGDGMGGDDHVFTDSFFRKYGDSNGNNVVDLIDFAAFRSVFGSQQGQSHYDESFENNGDNSIGLIEFADFRANFGT